MQLAPNKALAHPVRYVHTCVLPVAVTEIHSCSLRLDSPDCQGTPLSRGSIDTNGQRALRASGVVSLHR